MNPTFKTLLWREWMQGHRGWAMLAATPFVALLLALLFGGVQMDGEDTPTLVMVSFCGIYAQILAGLCWAVASFQAGGLARRDEQDRSIEFWRSLPVADWQAVAATALANLLLLPLAVVLVSLLSGAVLALLMVAHIFGAGAWLRLPWAELLAAWGAFVPRVVGGMVLAAFWLSPVLLAFMAASAWLKRWGVPVVTVGYIVAAQVLARAYDHPTLINAYQAISARFFHALWPAWRGGTAFSEARWSASQVSALPGWLMHDGLSALSELASPWALLALVVSAACFALLVWRRQRL